MRCPVVRACVVVPVVVLVVSAFGAGCPRTSLLGEPCDTAVDEPEVCEGPVKLRCNGQVYIELAPCHADCLDGTATVAHEQETIAQDTTWTCLAGAHIVTGTVVVAAGATLTIEPGSSVRVNPSSHIDVDPEGRVVVDASAGAPVILTSNNGQRAGFGSSTSGGLNVFSTEDPAKGSVLRHLIVERGIHGLGVFGLSSTTVAPEIKDCTFRDNENFGIKLACAENDPPIPAFTAPCEGDDKTCGNLFFNNGGEVSGCAE